MSSSTEGIAYTHRRNPESENQSHDMTLESVEISAEKLHEEHAEVLRHEVIEHLP